MELPAYEDRAAGFDFICRVDATIPPHELKAIPSNIALDIPEGYMLMVVPRSSTAFKKGLMLANSAGIIDPFYDGEDNEIFLLFYNFTSKNVEIKKGDKIAQGILVKYEKVDFDETQQLNTSKVKWNISDGVVES